MKNYWVSMTYNSGKRTVIGVLNYLNGEPVLIHHTVKTQYHHPTSAPGGVDVGLISFMKAKGINRLIHQTYGREITISELDLVPPQETIIRTGPFKGQKTKRVFIPIDMWRRSDLDRYEKPDSYNDEIALDETGIPFSIGVDTR